MTLSDDWQTLELKPFSVNNSVWLLFQDWQFIHCIICNRSTVILIITTDGQPSTTITTAYNQWRIQEFEQRDGASVSFPFTLRPFPFPPLAVGPLKSSQRSGECGELPSRVWGGATPKSNWMHFSFKIWPLVATTLVIFLHICTWSFKEWI